MTFAGLNLDSQAKIKNNANITDNNWAEKPQAFVTSTQSVNVYFLSLVLVFYIIAISVAFFIKNDKRLFCFFIYYI